MPSTSKNKLKSYTDRQLSARYPTDLPAWEALKAHRKQISKSKLAGLFAADPQRAERFTLTANKLTLDYSKNHLDTTTAKLLARLAGEAGVPAAIEAMFAGESINRSEDRPALHVALRAKLSDTVALDTPGVREVWEVLTKMDEFVEGVHAGKIAGSTGYRLTEIVNIGIGGSDLGPVMASRALRPHWHSGMRFHSVSNVDGTQLADLKRQLDPATTLFIVCSKTFTTQETMTNATPHGAGSSNAWARTRSAITSSRPRPTTPRWSLRHPPGTPLRVLGLGRRALLAVVGGRPVAGAGHRHGQVPRAARRRPADGPALPARADGGEPAGDRWP